MNLEAEVREYLRDKPGGALLLKTELGMPVKVVTPGLGSDFEGSQLVV
jgi:hypothetical protein